MRWRKKMGCKTRGSSRHKTQSSIAVKGPPAGSNKRRRRPAARLLRRSVSFQLRVLEGKEAFHPEGGKGERQVGEGG